MAAIPRWLVILVVIAVILFVLNATHILNIHFGVSADHWANPSRIAAGVT
jgi:hypothetical protein